MLLKCKILENNDSDICVLIQDKFELFCFSNMGMDALVGEDVLVNIEVYEDFEISSSNLLNKDIKYISGYQYNIIGKLDVDRGGIDSLFFIELDDLFGYEDLDNKMVELNVLRFNISFP